MQNTVTVLAVVLVVLLVVFLFSGAGMMGFGGFGMGPGMMGGGGMMGGYGAYAFNPLGAIISFASWALIIGGVALLVVWLVRKAGRVSLGASTSESPLDILKARYAKSEITKEQFDAMKRDLGV